MSSNKEIVLKTAKALFEDFDTEAAKDMVTEDYIQHNVGVPTGAAPILGFLPLLKEQGLKCTTHRVISEGNLVVLHNTYENASSFGAPTMIAFDMFRVDNDGKVAEHWDNLIALAEPNPSGHYTNRWTD